MQVECPKCHFRQPEDRFCARCGVDMTAYHPPEKSFFEKLVQNGTMIFLVGLILLFSGIFFYFKSTKLKDSAVEGGKKTIFISSYKSEAPSTSDAANVNNASATKDTNSAESPTPASGSLTKTPTDTQTTLKETAALTPNESHTSYTLSIQYAEVSLKGFETLEAEARTSGQYISSDYSQGVINYGLQKIKNLKNDITIYAHDKKIIKEGKNETWFQGLKSSNDNNNIGLTNELKIKEVSSDKITADLKIEKRYQINLSTPGAKEFQTMDYIGTLELGEEQVYFITNVLTTQPMLAQQEYLTSISPFEILKSINFKTGESLSVFFYHFEK